MSREDAQKLLENGKKITHKRFTSNEYVYINGDTGVITTEDGYDFSEQWWNVEMFKDGWTEYLS